jgi:hypothetical protein
MTRGFRQDAPPLREFNWLQLVCNHKRFERTEEIPGDREVQTERPIRAVWAGSLKWRLLTIRGFSKIVRGATCSGSNCLSPLFNSRLARYAALHGMSGGCRVSAHHRLGQALDRSKPERANVSVSLSSVPVV